MQAKIYEYLSFFGGKGAVNTTKSAATAPQIGAVNTTKSAALAPQIIIVNNNAQVALAAAAASYAGFECFCLPEFIAKRGDDLRSFSSELFKISEVLGAFYKSVSPKKLIISPFSTLLHNLPAKEHLSGFTLKKGEKIASDALKDKLLHFGYNLVDIIQDKGEARLSGEIIDIFSIDSAKPVRILLDFDEIESIKSFDEATQKSDDGELDSVYIAPFLAALTSSEYERVNDEISALDSDALIKDLNSFGFWYISGFKDYLSEFSFVFANEPEFALLDEYSVDIEHFKANLAKNIKKLYGGNLELAKADLNAEFKGTGENEPSLKDKIQSVASLVQNINAKFKNEIASEQKAKTGKSAKREFKPSAAAKSPAVLEYPKILEPKIYKDLQTSLAPSFFAFHAEKKITLLSANESSYKALNLSEYKNINLVLSPLVLNIISDEHIIVSLNKPGTKRKAKKASIIINELNIGDFVVHEDYGIGKFAGLELTKVLGVQKECVVINYAGNDRLLLPVEHLELIDRYIAGSGAVVSVDKLGKASFIKLKQKVREKLFAIANAIIALAAKRELINAPKFVKDALYDKFVLDAGFIYTDDQQSAIKAILADLSSGRPMDRLLSGDVGFGKTEVAMNALFLCARAGYQGLFFVPTTLLCAQHYASLQARFKPYDIEVCRLDRFSTAKQKASIKANLQAAKPMIVIGTHALLDIAPSKLGLIIIDEEHKFGVKQKEKLKELSEHSHILAMSATPIPRSLNMALSQVKGYSTLATPPASRLDVRTFVKKYDEVLIKEAIMRELRRKGQVFFVHNLIADLPRIKRELEAIVPNIRILCLHGKMDAKSVEDEMMKFADLEYDILLSTSIVESGIHLPNVNTILVNNASRFGIADLHQLRGRVGRSDKQGYCYFLVADDELLTDEAKRRLVALESNSFLGSGALLAYHDLEIRGGGNLLGESQSGHIEAIGYSLYLKMLESEINRCLSAKNASQNAQFSGDENSSEQNSPNSVDLRLSINAFINSELVSSDRVRLELYRRLSLCSDSASVYEIGAQIEDRFGKLDTYTKQFLDLIVIKILASKLGYKAISNSASTIALSPNDGERVILKAKSFDDDDIIDCILRFLRKG